MFFFVQNIYVRHAGKERRKKKIKIWTDLGMHSVLFIVMRMYEFLFLFIEKWIQYGTER